MKLIFLHGAPASGKLTVARALLEAVPGKLFDNHAAIDVARTVFDFGAPGFWDLVLSVRYAVVAAAAANGVPLLVMTYCYAEPDDRPALERFEAIVHEPGGELLPVFLRCAQAEAIKRVGNPDRRQRGKIATAEELTAFVTQYNIVQVPRANCLVFDTDSRPPEAVAADIIALGQVARA